MSIVVPSTSNFEHNSVKQTTSNKHGLTYKNTYYI